MIPSGGDPDQQISASDISKVKGLLGVKKYEMASGDVTKLVEREQEYLKLFEEKIQPEREERIKNDEERIQRKGVKQQELLFKEEERNRLIQKAKDEEFAKKLKEEER